jgi:hypothetical protein
MYLKTPIDFNGMHGVISQKIKVFDLIRDVHEINQLLVLLNE